MKNFTVKDLKEALKNLDENKKIQIASYNISDVIEVELIKEIKETGNEYYKIYIN